jgi:hypothetical protein
LIQIVSRQRRQPADVGVDSARSLTELRFTWPKERKGVRLAKLTDDIVVVPVKVLVVALLVLFLPAAS